jgi:hypothetical protein
MTDRSSSRGRRDPISRREKDGSPRTGDHQSLVASPDAITVGCAPMLCYPLRFVFVVCAFSGLALSGRAEENSTRLIATLGSTTISGYVDTSAQWMPASTRLPKGFAAFPIVFVTAPIFVHELSNQITGLGRRFAFVVHRIGRGTNDLMVYLNFKFGGDVVAQGGVTIPAGVTQAASVWHLPHNHIHESVRPFTASISLDPVRLRMEGARYRRSSDWPGGATVLLLDP